MVCIKVNEPIIMIILKLFSLGSFLAYAVNKNLVGVGYMSTDQKKKLLWGNKKSSPVEEVCLWIILVISILLDHFLLFTVSLSFSFAKLFS